MTFDEIDDALRRQPMWDPPAGFSRQVVALAVRLPASDTVRLTTAMTTLWYAVATFLASCWSRVSGFAWMVRQYWALLAR